MQLPWNAGLLGFDSSRVIGFISWLLPWAANCRWRALMWRCDCFLRSMGYCPSGPHSCISFLRRSTAVNTFGSIFGTSQHTLRSKQLCYYVRTGGTGWWGVKENKNVDLHSVVMLPEHGSSFSYTKCPHQRESEREGKLYARKRSVHLHCPQSPWQGIRKGSTHPIEGEVGKTCVFHVTVSNNAYTSLYMNLSQSFCDCG